MKRLLHRGFYIRAPEVLHVHRFETALWAPCLQNWGFSGFRVLGARVLGLRYSNMGYDNPD